MNKTMNTTKDYKPTISCITSYLPDLIITNDDLSKIVDTSDEWITTRTGIKQRHICKIDENAGDLAVKAAKKLVEIHNLDTQTLDAIIVATTTADRMPSAACKVQREICATNSFAFDISAACSGFTYALYVANSMLSDRVRNILIVSADSMSQFVDWSDRGTCVLFGDGASAALVTNSEHIPGSTTKFAISDVTIGSLCEEYDYDAITIDGGRNKNNIAHSVAHNQESNHEFIKMDGQYVFKRAVDTMSRSVKNIMSANGLSIEDINYIVPHQANKRIIDAICKFCSIDQEKFICTVDKHANTSAASIPLALSSAINEDIIVAGQKIITVSFGAGFTYGAALLETL